MQRDPEVLGHVTPQEMEEFDDAYIKRKTLGLSMLLSMLHGIQIDGGIGVCLRMKSKKFQGPGVECVVEHT